MIKSGKRVRVVRILPHLTSNPHYLNQAGKVVRTTPYGQAEIEFDRDKAHAWFWFEELEEEWEK